MKADQHHESFNPHEKPKSITMTQFLPYIHNLRGPAILFVVGVHARGGYADWSSHPGVYHFLQTFFDAHEGNGTVMFVFIAGFLFQHLTHHHFDFKRYLDKKFKVIIMPYLILSVPIILMRISMNFESSALPPGFNDRSELFQFFYYLSTGTHMPPFWFINMVLLLYFSSPLLRALDNANFYRYVLPLIFIASMFTYRPEHNANPFLAYLHLIPVYLTGMCVSFYKEKILSASHILLFPLFAIYLTLSILDLSGWTPVPPNLTFQKVLHDGVFVFNVYLFKSLMLCFILMFLFYLLRDKRMPLLDLLGDYSFGIFFVHFILIILLRKVLSVLNITVDFSLLTYLIYFLSITLISVVTVFFVKKLAGRYSRNLIGC